MRSDLLQSAFEAVVAQSWNRRLRMEVRLQLQLQRQLLIRMIAVEAKSHLQWSSSVRCPPGASTGLGAPARGHAPESRRRAVDSAPCVCRRVVATLAFASDALEDDAGLSAQVPVPAAVAERRMV